MKKTKAYSLRILTKVLKLVSSRVGYKPRQPDQSWASLSLLHSWPLLGLHEHLLEGKLPSPLSLISSPPPLAQDGKENDFNALCPQQRKEATYNLPDLETPRKKPPMMEQRKTIVGSKMEKREAQSSFNIFNLL